jgi:hypothetical protein
MVSKDDQELLLKRADLTLKMVKDIVDFRYKVATALIAGNLAACAAWLAILKDGKSFSSTYFYTSAFLLAAGLTAAAVAIAIMYASHFLAQRKVTGALASQAPPSDNIWVSEALAKAEHDRTELLFLFASVFCLLVGIGGIADALMRAKPEKSTAEHSSLAAPLQQSDARFRWHHDPASRDVVFP